MMRLLRVRRKDFVLYFIQGVLLIAVLIQINYIWYYSYICHGTLPPIECDFKETKEDILSDIAYAQSLSIDHPIASALQLDQDQKNQVLQYQKQAGARSKVLLEETSLALVQKAYVPQLICPTMTRVGTVKDSGYFLCNPWVLGKPGERCILYSIGIRGMIEFETDFYNITNQLCDSFCFDEHDEDPQVFETFHGTYMRARVSYKSDPAIHRYSIMDLMKKFGHTKLDVLKMDIDGGEHSALPTFLRQFKGTVCQLAIELHTEKYTEGKLWLRMAQILERRGYRLFHREWFLHNTRHVMYSYIHLNCFEKFGLSPQSLLFNFFD